MRVLITGASGFAGRALCRAARAAGHEVHALTRAPDRLHIDGELDVEPFEGSVGAPDDVARAAEGCEVVFHTAGVPRPPCSERVGRWLHVAGTENTLRAARHVAVRRVVHLSCADVTLHDGDRLHWDELRSLPRLPVGAHARSKLVAEEVALAQSDERLEVTALRPAWLWGPGDFDGLAYLHELAGSRGIALPGGGRNLLATTHIDNLVSAALAAASAEQAPGRAYHVTDGEFTEARELLGQLCQAAGLPAPRNGGPTAVELVRARLREGLGIRGLTVAEVLRLGRGALFDLSRASQDLDYSPGVDLEGAMAALGAWVEQRGGLAAVVRQARPPTGDRDIDAQVTLAGGD